MTTGNGSSVNGEFPFRDRFATSGFEALAAKLLSSYQEMLNRVSTDASSAFAERHLGVILASTKGRLGDFIFSPRAEDLAVDPLTPLLDQTLGRLGLKAGRSLVVSNACSSALAAMALAQEWLHQDLDDVLIFAGDVISDFVRQGFRSLNLLDNTHIPKPFSGSRAGFLLGEAAACIWLSRKTSRPLASLAPVGLDMDSSAVARPSPSADSLRRAIGKISKVHSSPPSLILAHGTGTLINDVAEDLAFSDFFGETTPPVTGSKWSIGHTLGASAAVDTILAVECLQRQSSFPLANTSLADSGFRSRYLTSVKDPIEKVNRVLVTSLGFGGLHAAALVERPDL
ncbi:MAG: beta-ketoacyl synthase N-terminal-like domain-containing protein [Bdellovibrionales bacterium]